MRAISSFFAVSMVLAVAACSGGEGDSAGGGGSAGDGGGGAAGAPGGGGSDTGGGGSAAGGGGAGAGGGTTSTSAVGGGGAGGSGGGGATGCETAGGEPVSFANDVQPLFQQSCGTASTCHFKSLPSGKLSLGAGKSHGALVGVASDVAACGDRIMVVPGNANESYLLDKLVETGAPAICGKRMPYDKAKLSDAKRQLITDWICQGALDN